MRILAIVTGEYGRRHAAHVARQAPGDWAVAVWDAPTLLPPVIDYPEEYLPASLPPADLLLAVAEHKGVAELLPDVAQMTGARAVVAAIDSEAWLPRGLARQLRGWLAEMGVACVTPKPLCSLTEHDYALGRRQVVPYADPLIAAFARHFGRPALRVAVDETTRRVTAVTVQRDAVCGCARAVAAGLVGATADEAAEKAGLLHHHFPCLASMGIDPDYDDTLMHVSGNILKDEVAAGVRPYRRVNYLRPGKRAE
ncbi:MAG: hypothetical protein KC425_27340 [Anaerolineales bacterium]|nr:hypothetical protein [Anaerolineales bacterium]